MSATLPPLSDLAAGDPAVRLLAETASTLRGDPGYVQRPGDGLGGLFLESESAAEPARDALSRVLGEIDALQAADARAHEAAALLAARSAARRGATMLQEIANLPEPLRGAVLGAMEAGAAWTFAGLGVRRLLLQGVGSGEVQLLRIEPGRGAAPHDHEGDELTLVVTGSYHDGHHHYAPGDISLAQPGFVHEPKADPGAVCYALGVSYGAPRFMGALGVAIRVLGLN